VRRIFAKNPTEKIQSAIDHVKLLKNLMGKIRKKLVIYNTNVVRPFEISSKPVGVLDRQPTKGSTRSR
jgi:hypothetical protein